MKNPFILYLLILLASNVHAQVGIGTVSPVSTLDVRGSFSGNARSFTGSTAASSTDYILLFTGTSASAVTLPDATTCTGRVYLVKNASTAGTTPIVTVNTTSSQTIDGLGSYLLDQSYESVILVSNGANWNVSAQSASANLGTGWNLGGNGVLSLQNLGTNSNFDLPFITNNTERMRISNAGNIGIGASVFNATNPEKLLVQAGITTSVNLMQGHGKINSYLQLNVQNDSAGTLSSSDVVATSDNGNETINFVDMGINSSGNTQNVMGSADDAYLYSTGNNFLIGNGTASKALVFMTGGTTQLTNERMRIDGSGNVGIGTSTFNVTSPEKLLVQAGTTTSFNLMQGHGKINNYLQLNVQNDSAGTLASSDVVATANNGNETINFVDMGINSSGNTQNVMGSANDAYLYSTGNNFLIGNGTASKALIFLTGGTTQSTNERVRIDGSGNVGIGTTAPTTVLDVNGTVKMRSTVQVGTAGTPLNAIIRFTNQSITDNTTFDFTTPRTETFTLAGVTQFASVIITPRSALPTGMVLAYAYASATNTVKLNLQTSSSSTSLGTMIFDITVIQ
jgi:3-methyladenine DNA glycosylase Mpg